MKYFNFFHLYTCVVVSLSWCTREGENSFTYMCGCEFVMVYKWGWEFIYIHVWLWACHSAQVRVRIHLHTYVDVSLSWCTREGENSFTYVCGCELVTVHTWGREFIYICVWLWACHGAHVRARRQLVEVGSFLTLCGFQGKLSCQVCQPCLYLPSTLPTPVEELLDTILIFSFHPLFLMGSCFLRWCLIFGCEFMLWETLLWRLQKALLVCADAFPDCVCVAPARHWEHGHSNQPLN